MSNCLLAAVAIRRRFGGKILWRPGWRRDGVRGFLGNPWGHFAVHVDDMIMSYSAKDKRLAWWRQVYFDGYIKVTHAR
jgi:hypothetical protein